MEQYVEDKLFENSDFTSLDLIDWEFESCTFENCNFSKNSLKRSRFSNCQFTDCNLSNTDISKVSFQEVTFINCKLLGLHFDLCNPFGLEIQLTSCQADYCVFYQLDMRKSKFIDTRCSGTDFTEANLAGVDMINCDFREAIFDRTILMKANLTDSYSYQIDPENNTLTGAAFSMPHVLNLLDKYTLKTI